MSPRLSSALAVLFVLSACGKERGSGPLPSGSVSARAASAQPPAPKEWSDFYGIQYRAPQGTSATARDGTLPGPGGQGGVATGVRPTVVLTKPGSHTFYVEILRSAAPVSLEGMKYALAGGKVDPKMIGKTTSTGWELAYDPPGAGDASTTKTHILYSDIAGGHFQCTFNDAGDADSSIAEAICRSIRPKAD